MPTTYMGLSLPLVSGDLNYWGAELNSNLSLIDLHDHSPGKGAPIASESINIDGDLSFHNHNLKDVSLISFNNQGVPITNSTTIYVRNGDLWFNDGSSNQIRLTASGSVIGAPGNITGMGPGDSIVLDHNSGKLSFNSKTGSSNMILQAAEFQAANQFTFGIDGTANLSAYGATIVASNGGLGDAYLQASRYYLDATDYIDFTQATSTYNFNAGGSANAIVRAATFQSTSGRSLDSTATGQIQIGNLSVSNDSGSLTIQSNKYVNSDMNSGGAITLFGNDAQSLDAGSIIYNAYGLGPGADSNSHIFYVRGGVNQKNEVMRINQSGVLISGNETINGNFTLNGTGTVNGDLNVGANIHTGGLFTTNDIVSGQGLFLSGGATALYYDSEHNSISTSSTGTGFGPNGGANGDLVGNPGSLFTLGVKNRLTGTINPFIVGVPNFNNGLQIICGWIVTSGATAFGYGFTSSRVSQDQYRIDFAYPFATVPIFLGIPQYPGGTCWADAIDYNYALVHCADNNGNGNGFNFLIIGTRGNY